MRTEILVIIIVLLILIILISTPSKNKQFDSSNAPVCTDIKVDVPKVAPILTLTESGGFAGKVYVLNIYEDVYSVHVNSKLAKTGYLCAVTQENIKLITSEFDKLNDSYCKIIGNDIVYYQLKIGNRSVNLGTFSKDCAPSSIYDSVNLLKSIIGDVQQAQNSMFD